MNILPLNTYKYQTPVFGAKKSKKEEIGPEKLNFTEVEEEFKKMAALRDRGGLFDCNGL